MSQNDEPRWLSEAEQDSWRPFAAVMMKLPAALDAQLLRDSGMTHFEYLVLGRLAEAPDETVRMSELASFVAASLSRLSHVVKRLEDRGWVRRRPCPEDGRYTNAVLTKPGRAKVVAAAPGHVAAVRELVVDALSATQYRQLGSAAKRILHQIEPTSR
ncbi:MarR family winged helix-turn-helix transcriptional regulator [Tenggerimyces flavus]|uniref:MarR family winged helix-turn-helix transcriptional regulator n=1 Tax=Tenggerimyces flavus TaxID=1708749 RepID=A0ABV7YJ63_9ACTN|nr:MarR family transcriptional regulator [Tenggerimyces flavus]MBM7787464.1 DNA-binding MarR family transcriptional regulator [Tenggerimyces flavus]